jgi:branched-chain amino acid transport system substrate-binding protein
MIKVKELKIFEFCFQDELYFSLGVGKSSEEKEMESSLSLDRPMFNLMRLISYAGLLLLLSCSGGEPVTIGFVGGLSGRVADLGINGRNGVHLAVDEWNQRGGINGRPVKLLVEDDKQDKDIAIKAVRSLLDQKASVIIGHMTSSMTMATIDLVNKSKAVMISPTTTTDYLTGIDDNFLRVSTTTLSAATKMANYLLGNADIKAVTVIYDLNNKAYTESWLKAFRKAFEAGKGTILKVETFSSNKDTSLLKTVENSYDEKAQGLVIISNAMDAAMLCQQVRKINWSVQITLSEWASTGSLIELGGEAVEGVYLSQFFDHSSTKPSYISFKSKYQKEFASLPGFAAVNAYDAANAVMTAMAARKDAESIKEAILRIATFQGVQGPISIDRYGDADRKTVIGKVSNSTVMVFE